MHAARQVLARNNEDGIPAVDAMDLVSLASWILTGIDPWQKNTHQVAKPDGDGFAAAATHGKPSPEGVYVVTGRDGTFWRIPSSFAVRSSTRFYRRWRTAESECKFDSGQRTCGVRIIHRYTHSLTLFVNGQLSGEDRQEIDSTEEASQRSNETQSSTSV